ncbi:MULTISPECIES: hypothetical protein [unclassified Actinotalea]|uniref:hypothetical protein n=1 Tax=unclassified Actinotalea TaxID=2638618 RepID=UPI0015F4D237|nr:MULTISPECIES: hypothetical protein [unclassified Actinotalea]
MTSRPRHAVVTAAASVASVTLALTLSACSATNPITTQDDYAASDGVMAQVGDLRAGNLVILTTGDGEPGALVGAVTNDGDDAEVTFALDGEEIASFEVRSRETVLLNQDGEEVEIAAVDAAPGTFARLMMASDVSGSTTVNVPVLDGTLPEYADHVPDAE